MLKVSRSTFTSYPEIILSGVIDETTNLKELIGPIKGKVFFNAVGVNRINSAGVKNWLLYFEEIKSQNVDFSFSQLSVVLVEQLNSISNFNVGSEVLSIEVPYLCQKCHKESRPVLVVSEIDPNVEPPTQTCPHCQSPDAKFDDFLEEFFAFKR